MLIILNLKSTHGDTCASVRKMSLPSSEDEVVLNCLQVVWIPQRHQSAACDNLNTVLDTLIHIHFCCTHSYRWGLTFTKSYFVNFKPIPHVFV